MREEFTKVLRLRFDERNRRMIERFTEEKQRFNARGILPSSETVVAMHKVLETELKESTLAVVATAIDAVGKKPLPPSKRELQAVCSNALSNRKDEIEGKRSINRAPCAAGSHVIGVGGVFAQTQPGGSAMFQGSSAS